MLALKIYKTMSKTTAQQLQRTQVTALQLGALSPAQKNRVLLAVGKALWKKRSIILAANQLDLAAVPKDYPMHDRLSLNSDRIAAMVKSLQAVAKLPDPVGEILETQRRPSGITVQRRRVPFGVIGVIFEARPNVAMEVWSLTFKTGNAVVLKGGRDAEHTVAALVKLIHNVLRSYQLSTDCIAVLNPRDAAAITTLLTARGLVDVIIPRGGQRLIEYVRTTATIPVIETGAGVCHTYVEKTADLKKAVNIVVNAKTRRCTVCNALDCLVVDQAIIRKFLPLLAKALAPRLVELRADAASYKVLQQYYPKPLLRQACAADYHTEFLAMRLAIKTVPNAKTAFLFIQATTSQHSEAIVTRNQQLAQQFCDTIDAAAVYVNTSTAFTDGFEFGLGAEIGIATQKLHARGPMGLTALTTYKWIITSQGAVRRS
ncbi:MAG: hypothetical protein ACD_43C00115G0002 [uncultured bacterium]|nr:MAG: hypothetical protein ACD_43C00115G0002 [uncultured bacterium]